jgi:hypothetical protein
MRSRSPDCTTRDPAPLCSRLGLMQCGVMVGRLMSGTIRRAVYASSGQAMIGWRECKRGLSNPSQTSCRFDFESNMNTLRKR